MLDSGKIVPLRHYLSVCFKIEIGFIVFDLTAREHLENMVHKDGVDTGVLILGQYRDKSEVDRAGVLESTEKANEGRGGKSATAFLKRLTDRRE